MKKLNCIHTINISLILFHAYYTLFTFYVAVKLLEKEKKYDDRIYSDFFFSRSRYIDNIRRISRESWKSAL